MARVGRLFVDLLARTASFEAGLDKSKRKTRKFSQSVTANLKKIGVAFAAMGAAAAAGLAVMVKKSIDSADNLSKLSQKTGIAVESLSGLSFAAGQSGVDLENLSARMVNLARRAKEGDRGVLSYRQAFDKLGITLRGNDGKLKGTEQLLLEVSDAFSVMEDGTLKAALATDIFSNQGVSLIPFLNQGAEGIRKMKEEAADLGLIMDTETALAAEQFNDNLDKLQGALTGVAITVAAELLPQLGLLTESAVDFAKKGAGAKKLAEGIASAFKEIAIFASAANTTAQIAFIGLGTPVQAFLELLRAPFTGTLAGVTGVLEQARIEMEKIAEQGAIQLVTLSEGLKKVGEAAETAGGGGTGGGLSTFTNGVQKIIDKLQEEIETFNLSELSLLRRQFALEGATAADTKLAISLKNTLEIFKDFEEKVTTSKTKIEELNAPVVMLKEEMDSLARILGLASVGLDELGIAGQGAGNSLEPLAPKLIELKDAGKLVESGFERTFDDAISGGKNLTKILQGIIKELAKMIIKSLILKALGFFGIPGFSKGGPVEGLQAGGRALVGEPVLVGERGPELFVPDVAGEILPNDVFRGAQTALRAAEEFEPAGGSGQPQTVNHFHIEGLISGDRLDEVIEKISRRVQFNDAFLIADDIR